MSKKDIYWGFILILIALYIVVSSVGLLPKLPVVKIVFTILFAAWAIKGLCTLSSFEFFVPVGILGCMYQKALGIESLVPWPWWLAMILLVIGFDMVLKNVKKNRKYKKFHDSVNGGYTQQSYAKYPGKVDNSADGAYVSVKNMFSETSKYVNSTNFSSADIDNKFGQTNVYFNNAIMPAGANGSINVENSFGETNIYIPGTWRAEIIRNATFGEVNVHGQGNNDMDAHFIVIKADCTFGEINIYFE